MRLWLINNTNTFELDELANAETQPPTLLDGSYTVQATLMQGGVAVAGQAWPVALTYQGANGRFIGRGSHTLELVDYEEYDVFVQAYNAADGIYGEWNGNVTARYRGVE